MRAQIHSRHLAVILVALGILLLSGVAVAQVYTPTPPPPPRPTPAVGVIATETPEPTESPSPSPSPTVTRVTVTSPTPTPCICPSPTPVGGAGGPVGWLVLISFTLIALLIGLALGIALGLASCRRPPDDDDGPIPPRAFPREMVAPEPELVPEQFGATGGGETFPAAAPNIVVD